MSARPDWFDTVRAGDVLGTPSGLRLVRAVSRGRKTHGRGVHTERLYVYFAIRRCSWTRRPYTLYCGTDPYLRRCVWVGRYKGTASELDRRIEQEITCDRYTRYASCREVGGLP